MSILQTKNLKIQSIDFKRLLADDKKVIDMPGKVSLNALNVMNSDYFFENTSKK